MASIFASWFCFVSPPQSKEKLSCWFLCLCLLIVLQLRCQTPNNNNLKSMLFFLQRSFNNERHTHVRKLSVQVSRVLPFNITNDWEIILLLFISCMHELEIYMAFNKSIV